MFLELVKKRYSVRAYKSIPVENDKLNQVLEAARLAPTASNRQPFQFIVIHTAGREEELRLIYDRSWFVQAPFVICACSIPNQAWIRRDGKNYCEVYVAIAMYHLVLAATDIGLGTCWIAAFDTQAAREILKLPDSVEAIAFTPLGYPDDQPNDKRRKAVDELIRHEQW